ncbi:hypothetical protein C8T65DRAFT_646822, partial [Cerioporus squamosus]
MRFSVLLAIVSVASTVSASPAGVYTGDAPTLAYYPQGIEPTSSMGFRFWFGARSADLSCTVSCNGQSGRASDISTAEAGLEGFFGSRLCWSKQIFYLFNSAYAFGCDYGHGQCQTTSQYQEEVACVDDACGNTRADERSGERK